MIRQTSLVGIREVVEKEFKDKFIHYDDVVNVLSLGYKLGKNVLLYGPGGHGKSEMTEAFFRAMNIEPFVQTCGEGTTAEILFGGINAAKAREEGVIEFLVENSWMAHEYVILEEGLDADIMTLAVMKDTLTSGVFRNGSQQYKIKTKMVVILTNRSKEEVAEDDSAKAFLERFPYTLHVKWPSYDRKDFKSLFKTVFGKDNRLLSETIPEARKRNVISPRTAVWMYETYEEAGLDSLIYLDGIDSRLIAKMKEREKDLMMLESQKDSLNEYLKEYLGIKKSYGLAVKREDINKIMSYHSRLQTLIKKLNNTRWYDELFMEGSSLRDKLVKLHKEITNGIKHLKDKDDNKTSS